MKTENSKTTKIQNLPQTTAVDAETQAQQRSASALVHFIWAIALVSIFAMLIFGLVPMLMTREVVQGGAQLLKDGASFLVRGFDGISEAFKPGVSAHNVYLQTIAAGDQSGKLVVFEQNIDLEIFKEEQMRRFADYIPWGKASVRLKVQGNRVQFYVPLDRLSADNFVFDRRSGVLTVEVPPVVLDQEMVSVQSDPAMILEEKNGSWVPFSTDVEKLSVDARAELKNQVILTANDQRVRDQARQAARAKLEQLFLLMRNSLNQDVKLQIYLP
jgi:hypothetical protein